MDDCFFRKHCILLISLFLSVCSISFGQNNKRFTVVIDAGHGGKDPGAIGAISREKNINLAIALKLGKLISDKTNAKVIYTRTTDRFVILQDRADIANRAKANMMISIHTNDVPRARNVQGAETYTLGLARSDENLEVAKRENSVILFEDDYHTRYDGFDPNSSESYIIFEMMQNKYMKQSVEFATAIQKNFKNQCKRVDRGVKQGALLVLRNTGMPSVLVEVGFISNRTEEKYLNTEKGQRSIATAIFNAFLKSKEDYEKTQGIAVQSVAPITDENDRDESMRTVAENESQAEVDEPAETAVTSKKGTVYKIQIMASDTPIKKNSSQFKGLKNVDYYKENGWYKYTYGETSDYKEIRRIKKTIVDKKFKQSFIISFRDGKKVKTR